MIITHKLAEESVMTDLYTRIIGSRLLEAGRSPYFYNEQLPDSINLSNPNVSFPYGLNGVTAPPFFLWLQQPFAKMNFCSIKFIWWIIEELLMLATVIFSCMSVKKFGKQLLTILVCMIFFCYSRNWFQHIYSGQYYVVFAFIFSLAIWFSKKNSAAVLSVFPVAALIRPFFAVASLPWLLKKQSIKINFKYLFLGMMISAILFILSGTINLMPEFTKAVNIYAHEEIGWTESRPTRKPGATPPKLEACVFKTDGIKSFEGGCLYSLQHYLKLLGLRSANPLFFSALLLLAIFTFIYLTGYKRITATTDNILLASFIIYILAELFTPANRNPYNLVQYLALMGLVINRGNTLTLLLLLSGLALNHDFPFRFPYQREAGEAVILLSIYLLFYLPQQDSLASQQAEN